jgi:hypothetical protein
MPGRIRVAINPEELLERPLAEGDRSRTGELLEALMVHGERPMRRSVGFRLSRGACGHGAVTPSQTCSQSWRTSKSVETP